MSDQAHQGSKPASPSTRHADTRIPQLYDLFQFVETAAESLPLFGLARDVMRTQQGHRDRPSTRGQFARGTVVHAIPNVNWYKVQVGGYNGWVAACKLDHTSLTPLGPRETGTLAPNTSVLLHMPQGLNHWQIVGVIPPRLLDGRLACPDWVVQGSGAGLRREDAHKFPIKNLYSQGGVQDWSAGRPRDETTFQKGWITPTGLAVTVDDFLAQVRVNEMCGLFMTLFDGWCRLAGQQLTVESLAHEESAGDDEGESRHFRGVAAYPWEALGLYAPDTPLTREYDERAVEYLKHRARLDLPEGGDDAQPVYRYQEYGGYLGQGHFRTVMLPGLRRGLRQLQPELPDEGLFRESVGLDGTYSLTSAKRLHIGKRCKIVVPKRVKLPEDAAGDDAAANNYSFSGRPGALAPPHKIADVRVPGGDGHMLRVAAVQDVIAYVVNWQALHPFHYHQGDYKTWQESEAGAFGRVQGVLDFGTLGAAAHLDPPAPVPLNIDHRYGDVAYFERESFLVFHDDGSVQLGCGYGSGIVLSAGGITLEAPAFIRLLAGTDLVARAAQVSVNSHGSMDLSSANGDQRFKAERNQHFLSGNSGSGGTLLESRGTGLSQQYKNRLGEEVVSSGVVVKATAGVCALLGRDIYLRTVGARGGGDITIDASAGENDVLVYGRQVEFFAQEGFGINIGPVDDVSEVTGVYRFGGSSCIIDADLLLNGRVESVGDGGVYVAGSVWATGSVVCGGAMGDGRGGVVGKTPPETVKKLKDDLGEGEAFVVKLRDSGRQVHRAAIVEKYYRPGQLGDGDTIALIQFSFRDGPGRDQYRTGGLKFPESRWMTMARFGLAVGGAFPWTENPVEAQGEQTYPWPGRRAWLDEPRFLELAGLGLFDPDAGRDRDRPGPYEDFTLSDFEATTMAAGYKVNRQ
jgi:hypothetical protein